MDKSIANYKSNGKIANIIENGGLTLPFENTIYLQSLKIAGIYYYVNKDIVLLEGDKLKLKREPDNEYDEYAIEIFTIKDKKLGYIPRNKNKILARLMDGGKILSAKVRSADYYFEELQEVLVKIYLEDF